MVFPERQDCCHSRHEQIKSCGHWTVKVKNTLRNQFKFTELQQKNWGYIGSKRSTVQLIMVNVNVLHTSLPLFA